jgi:hypothetical protein
VIFTPEMVKLVVARRKTQTRRIIGDEKHCRYRVRHAYRVQPGRGKRGLFAITITDVYRERLSDIDLKGAHREGFRTRQQFFEHWHALHGMADHDVWVISFVVGDVADTPRLLAARLGTAGGDYTSVPVLAARGEQESPSAAELERYSKTAGLRDHDRARAKIIDERSTIALSLQRMRACLQAAPNRELSSSVRQLEHQLALLDRKLSAA